LDNSRDITLYARSNDSASVRAKQCIWSIMGVDF